MLTAAQAATVQAQVGGYYNRIESIGPLNGDVFRIGHTVAGAARVRGADGVYRLPFSGPVYYFVPAIWGAGGGGMAKLSDEAAAAQGGSPFTVSTPTSAGGAAGIRQGFLFDYDPSGWAVAGNSNLSYTPGRGGKAATLGYLQTIAIIAAPIGAVVFAGQGFSAVAGGVASTASSAGGTVAQGTAAAASQGATIGAAAGQFGAQVPGASAFAQAAPGLAGQGAAVAGSGIQQGDLIASINFANVNAPVIESGYAAVGTVSGASDWLSQLGTTVKDVLTTGQKVIGAAGTVATAVKLASHQTNLAPATLAPRAAPAPAPTQISVSALLLAALGFLGYMMVA